MNIPKSQIEGSYQRTLAYPMNHASEKNQLQSNNQDALNTAHQSDIGTLKHQQTNTPMIRRDFQLGSGSSSTAKELYQQQTTSPLDHKQLQGFSLKNRQQQQQYMTASTIGNKQQLDIQAIAGAQQKSLLMAQQSSTSSATKRVQILDQENANNHRQGGGGMMQCSPQTQADPHDSQFETPDKILRGANHNYTKGMSASHLLNQQQQKLLLQSTNQYQNQGDLNIEMKEDPKFTHHKHLRVAGDPDGLLSNDGNLGLSHGQSQRSRHHHYEHSQSQQQLDTENIGHLNIKKVSSIGDVMGGGMAAYQGGIHSAQARVEASAYYQQVLPKSKDATSSQQPSNAQQQAFTFYQQHSTSNGDEDLANLKINKGSSLNEHLLKLDKNANGQADHQQQVNYVPINKEYRRERKVQKKIKKYEEELEEMLAKAYFDTALGNTEPKQVTSQTPSPQLHYQSVQPDGSQTTHLFNHDGSPNGYLVNFTQIHEEVDCATESVMDQSIIIHMNQEAVHNRIIDADQMTAQFQCNNHHGEHSSIDQLNKDQYSSYQLQKQQQLYNQLNEQHQQFQKMNMADRVKQEQLRQSQQQQQQQAATKIRSKNDTLEQDDDYFEKIRKHENQRHSSNMNRIGTDLDDNGLLKHLTLEDDLNQYIKPNAKPQVNDLNSSGIIDHEMDDTQLARAIEEQERLDFQKRQQNLNYQSNEWAVSTQFPLNVGTGGAKVQIQMSPANATRLLQQPQSRIIAAQQQSSSLNCSNMSNPAEEGIGGFAGGLKQSQLSQGGGGVFKPYFNNSNKLESKGGLEQQDNDFDQGASMGNLTQQHIVSNENQQMTPTPKPALRVPDIEELKADLFFKVGGGTSRYDTEDKNANLMDTPGANLEEIKVEIGKNEASEQQPSGKPLKKFLEQNHSDQPEKKKQGSISCMNKSNNKDKEGKDGKGSQSKACCTIF